MSLGEVLELGLILVVFRIIWDLLYFIFKKILFIDLLLEMGEGGRRGGIETAMCGCLLHTPNWGSGSQPRHVP